MAGANVDLITTLIIEDQTLVSDLLTQEFKHHNVSATAVTSIEQAFNELKKTKPDIVLLDVGLEEPLSIHQVRDLVRRCHPGKVALFTSSASETFIRNCIDVGVRGLIPKTFSISSLKSALSLINSGQVFVPLSQQASYTPRNIFEKYAISLGEHQVLEKLSEGMSNKDITVSLNIPETTVKMRVRSLCKKLGAENRTQALVVAQRLGLVQPNRIETGPPLL